MYYQAHKAFVKLCTKLLKGPKSIPTHTCHAQTTKPLRQTVIPSLNLPTNNVDAGNSMAKPQLNALMQFSIETASRKHIAQLAS